MKPCIKCGATNRDKSGKCRPCKKKSSAIWKKANSDKLRARSAEYRAANPEKVRATKARWEKANPGKSKAWQAKYRTENPEKARAATAKYRTKNPKKVKATTAKGREANPEAIRIWSHNRRARKIANGGKLSSNLAELLFKRQKGKCACCQEPLGGGYHLDHIVPLSLGGANEDWNIQLLTATCNLNKGAKTPIDYMRSKGLLL